MFTKVQAAHFISIDGGSTGLVARMRGPNHKYLVTPRTVPVGSTWKACRHGTYSASAWPRRNATQFNAERLVDSYTQTQLWPLRVDDRQPSACIVKAKKTVC